MQLIDDVGKAHKMASMIVAAVIAALGAIYGFSDSLKTMLSPATFGWLMMGLGILAAVARVIKQNLDGTPPAPPAPEKQP